MDTSDPDIFFDENNICNHCKEATFLLNNRVLGGTQGHNQLTRLLDKVKFKCKNVEYDGIIGLSGGVDSSYLLHILVKKFNLRILAIHINSGWNSEIAENNIETLVKSLNVDLYTYVVDWDEMRELQLAYLRSGLINQDVPQDHLFFSILYKVAFNKNIRYIFTGHNVASESIMPKSWGYNSSDATQLYFINKKFGTHKLKSYKTISLFHRILYTLIQRQEIIKPLDFLDYNKTSAIQILKENFNWKEYRYKHGESIWTSFYQNFWLIERNGIDKRKAHYSSLIVSGQLSRKQALELLENAPVSCIELKRIKKYISLKLKICEYQLDQFLKQPVTDYSSYPNSSFYYNILFKLLSVIKYKKGKF